MSKYCSVCKKELADTAVFCTECGTSVKQTTPQAPPVYKPVEQQVDPAYGVVGMGTYFGLIFLFAIPGIGLLACLLLCFIPKRRSLKNFARAMLIWSIIALILAIVAAIAAKMAINSIVEYLNQMTGGDLTNLEGLLMEIQQGGLEEILETLPTVP